jgi:hypothetical protein
MRDSRRFESGREIGDVMAAKMNEKGQANERLNDNV